MEIPAQFSTKVVERIDDESWKKIKSFTDLIQAYQAHKLRRGRFTFEPGRNDMTTYKKWINKEITNMEARKALGVKSPGTMQNRFAQIGRKIALGETNL